MLCLPFKVRHQPTLQSGHMRNDRKKLHLSVSVHTTDLDVCEESFIFTDLRTVMTRGWCKNQDMGGYRGVDQAQKDITYIQALTRRTNLALFRPTHAECRPDSCTRQISGGPKNILTRQLCAA